MRISNISKLGRGGRASKRLAVILQDSDVIEVKRGKFYNGKEVVKTMANAAWKSSSETQKWPMDLAALQLLKPLASVVSAV